MLYFYFWRKWKIKCLKILAKKTFYKTYQSTNQNLSSAYNIPLMAETNSKLLTVLHITELYCSYSEGFPGGAVVKNLPANAGDSRDSNLIPGLGRYLGVGNGNPLRYSCLGNPTDRGACAAVHGVAKSLTQQSDWAPTCTRAYPYWSVSVTPH